MEKNAIFAQGKAADVFHALRTGMDNGIEPKIVLLDAARDYMQYFNYGAIEHLKNGLIMSGKYESTTLFFHHPHVIIFSNSRPDTSKFSENRWNIVNIAELLN